uniref:Uncharacterized protein n=1 Tax=Anguilla anguilla TaxID=7936 RepID=A0A0E9WT11_ANGAN
MSSNLTLTRLARRSCSRGSSRSRSTVLKNRICGMPPAARASQIRRFPSRSTFPCCSRNFLERATLTALANLLSPGKAFSYRNPASSSSTEILSVVAFTLRLGSLQTSEFTNSLISVFCLFFPPDFIAT